MTPFTQRVVAVIRSIPAGKVMTYGQIAAAAGSPRGARQVVRILHSMSAAHRLPWHRVVNAEGRIALPDPDAAYTQEMLLARDGVEVGPGGRVDLEIYRLETVFRPGEGRNG